MAKFRGTALVFTALMLLLFSVALDVSVAALFTPSNNPTISDVRITNVRDTGFTVSWITDQDANGTVQYGTDAANLNQTAQDDRGAATNDDTHHVSISGLSPNTTYHFNVLSDATTNNNNGTPYTVTTGATLAIPGSDTVFGEVFKANGSTVAEGTIVYITVRDNNAGGSLGSAAPLSMLVDNSGFWNTGLGNARSSDLNSYFSYSVSGGDELVIEAQGANDGIASQTVDTANDTPAASMTLTIVPRPNVDLSPNAAQSGNPGATVNYAVQMTNTGNVTDTFNITVSGNTWTTTQSPTSAMLAPGVSTTINVAVTIPAGTAAGTSDSATIVATSALSNTITDNTSLTTTANQVPGVSLTSPTVSQMGVVGTTATYTLNITNTGNANDTFALSIGGNSWVTTLSPTPTISLNAGASGTIMVDVQIPANAAANMTDTVTITAISGLSPNPSANVTLETKAIAAAPGVTVSPDAAQSGRTGTTINYTLQVSNTGNVNDTFNITVAGNSWNTSPSPLTVGPLAPNTGGTLNVSVSVPLAATAGMTDTATIVATSTYSSSISGSASLTTTATVTPTAGVDLSPNEAMSGDPGTTVDYTLELTNTGNVNDTFTITVGSGNSWMTTALPPTVTLNAGASTTIAASVMIPAGTSAGASDMATIMATSTFSPTVTDNTTLTTTANQVPGVGLTSPTIAQMGVVNTTVIYTLNITNTGNANDTFTLSIGGNSWVTTLSPTPTISLNAGASGTITALVQIPANAATNMTDTVTITATSGLSPNPSDNVSLETKAIAAAPAVTVSPDAAQSGRTGTTVNYSLQVANTGNVNDTFTVTVSGNNWNTTLSPSTVGPLAPTTNGTLNVSVSVPLTATAGMTDTATIVATSMYSPSISASASLTTTATVTPTAGVDLSPDEAMSGEVGNTITYTLPLTNTGNVSDTINLSVSGNPAWTTNLSSNSVFLNAGQSTMVTVTVMIPSNATPNSTDTATINAVSTFDGSKTDSATLTTTAILIPRPSVAISPDMAKSGIGSTTVTYTLEVSNTGNVADNYSLSVSNNNWNTTLSPSSINMLNAGAKTTVIASVMIPLTATTGMQDNASITIASTIYPTPTATTNLTTTAMAAVVGVDLSPNMTKDGMRGHTVTYPLTVTNNGNLPDTFAITVGTGQAFTTTVSPTSVGPLAPGASVNVTATVMVPATAAIGMSDTATITATSSITPTSDTTTLTTVVTATRGVDLSANMAKTGQRNETVNYVVTISNTGEIADSFALSLTGQSWTSTIVPPNVTLGAGVSTTVIVSVTLPSNASNGQTDTVTLTATSQGNSSVTDSTSLTTTANVPPPPNTDVFGVELPGDMSMQRKPGTTVSYPVTIKNTGNTNDTFVLTLQSAGVWPVSVSSNSVTLNAGASTTVNVQVTIPADVSTMTLDTVTLTATSQGDPSVSDSVNLNTTAMPNPVVYGVDLSANMAQNGAINGTVSYTVEISNTGSTTDTFNLAISGNTWTTAVSPASVILNAGGKTTVQVNVTIPANANNNDNDSAILTATSKGNGSVSDSTNLTTSAVVEPNHGVQLSNDMAQSDVRGNTVNYEVTVINTGDVNDTFDLAVSGNSWNTSLSAASVTLNNGASTTVVVSVEIPADAANGESDTATVTATSQGNNSVSDATNLTTTGLIDDDGDGVSDDQEDDAPNGGDGNGDGTPDSEQANVTSLPNAEDQSYVTLVSPEGTSLVDVNALSASDLPTTLPEVVELQQGAFDFMINGVGNGGSAVVTLILRNSDAAINSYWKYGPTPDDPTDHWYEFNFDGSTGAEINGNTITLHFVDGQRGDHDLTVNGQITDPGGPAITQTTTSISLGSFEQQTGTPWQRAGQLLLLGLSLAAGLLAFRKRKNCL